MGLALRHRTRRLSYPCTPTCVPLPLATRYNLTRWVALTAYRDDGYLGGEELWSRPLRQRSSERQSAWIEGLEATFHHFGGVTREVLFYNARAIVDFHDSMTREVRFNERLRAFARHWSFTPRAYAPTGPVPRARMNVASATSSTTRSPAIAEAVRGPMPGIRWRR